MQQPSEKQGSSNGKRRPRADVSSDLHEEARLLAGLNQPHQNHGQNEEIDDIEDFEDDQDLERPRKQLTRTSDDEEFPSSGSHNLGEQQKSDFRYKVVALGILIVIEKYLKEVAQNQRQKILEAKVRLCVDQTYHSAFTDTIGRILVHLLADTVCSTLVNNSREKGTWILNLSRIDFKAENERGISQAIDRLLEKIKLSRADYANDSQYQQMVSIKYQLNGSEYGNRFLTIDNSALKKSAKTLSGQSKKTTAAKKKRSYDQEDELRSEQGSDEVGDDDLVLSLGGDEEAFIPRKERQLRSKDLHTYVQQDDPELIKQCLCDANNSDNQQQLYSLDPDGMTPLLLAVKNNKLKALSEILKQSLDLGVLHKVLNQMHTMRITRRNSSPSSALKFALQLCETEMLDEQVQQNLLNDQSRCVALLLVYGAPVVELAKSTTGLASARNRLIIKMPLRFGNNPALESLVFDQLLKVLENITQSLNGNSPPTKVVLELLGQEKHKAFMFSLLSSGVVYKQNAMPLIKAIIAHPDRSLLLGVIKRIQATGGDALNLFKSLLLSCDPKDESVASFLTTQLKFENKQDKLVFDLIEGLVGSDWLKANHVNFAKSNGRDKVRF